MAMQINIHNSIITLSCLDAMNLYNQIMPSSNENACYIEPINVHQRDQVVELTLSYLEAAKQCFNKNFAPIPIVFDLQGKCACMYQRSAQGRRIRYNPYLMSKYFQHSLDQTVPHEVAHYVTDCMWPFRRVRPHGKEWRSVMEAFGVEPKVTGNFDLTGIPVKQYQKFTYSCSCKIHQLSAIRHRRQSSGMADYYCRACKQRLERVAD
jgi:SprT protein